MTFNFEIINKMLVPTIVIFSLILGYILKKWAPTDNKYIPTVLVLIGAVLGGIISGWNLESITAGMLSALASTGLHQAFYQYMKIDSTTLIEVDAMGPDLEEEEEKVEKIEEAGE